MLYAGSIPLDPMYLNGWVAIFQFLFALVLAIPCSYISRPPVPLNDLPKNLLDGLKCFLGQNTIVCADEREWLSSYGNKLGDNENCVPDSCSQAPLFVTIYLLINQVYNLLIIYILKYGSANLLYLVLTVMVPLGNLAFTLPFIPQRSVLHDTDIAGLVVICFGLACYRFAGSIVFPAWKRSETILGQKDEEDQRGGEILTQKLLD